MRPDAGVALLAACVALAYRGLFGWGGPATPPGASALEGTPFAVDFSPLPYALFLVAVFLRRETLRRAFGAPGDARIAILFLAPGATLYLWAHLTGAADLLIPSLVLVILGGSWLLAGASACRALVLPTSILLFAIPMPAVLRNQWTHPLQLGSAALASTLLDVLGVSNLRSGDRLLVGDRTFQVVEECSGVASISALLLAGLFYVSLLERGRLRSTLVVLSALPIAYFMNGLRVAWLAVAAPTGRLAEHELQGLVVIVVAALALCAVDRLLGFLLNGSEAASGDSVTPAASRLPPGLPLLRLIALGTLLVGLAAAAPWLAHPSSSASRAAEHLTRLAAELEPWPGEEVELDRSQLGSVGFTAYLNRRFSVKGGRVTVFIGVDDRLDRRVSARSGKTAFPGSGWIAVKRGPLDLGPGREGAEALVLRRNGQRLLVYHWTAGFRSLPIEVARAALALDQRPGATPEVATVVRVSTPLGRGRKARLRAAGRLRAVVDRLPD